MAHLNPTLFSQEISPLTPVGAAQATPQKWFLHVSVSVGYNGVSNGSDTHKE